MSEQDKDGEGKPMKITFAEGCFDDFEGTQEELDELVAHIKELAASGELLENATVVNLTDALDISLPADDLEEIDDEVLELLPMLTSGNTRH